MKSIKRDRIVKTKTKQKYSYFIFLHSFSFLPQRLDQVIDLILYKRHIVKDIKRVMKQFMAITHSNQKEDIPENQNIKEMGIECNVCGRKFVSDFDFIKHFESCDNKSMNQNEVRDFQCEICMQMFESETDFLNHLGQCVQKDNKQELQIEPLKNYECDDCKQEFQDEILYLNHLENCDALVRVPKPVEVQRKFICEQCSQQIESQLMYLLHISNCEQERRKQRLNEERQNQNSLIEGIQCETCQTVYKDLEELKEHLKFCAPSIIKDDFQYDYCQKCKKQVLKLDSVKHQEECKRNLELIDEDEKLAIELGRGELDKKLVNDLQLKAIQHVQSESKQLSEKCYLVLLQRVKKLKFTEEDLKMTQKFICLEAPIIVHVNLAKYLKFYLNDTHYRNQFETGSSSGALNRLSRIEWEDRCFNKIYHKASDTQRVQYGVLNIVNDPIGVQNCYSYGNSYLVLNNETVRLRCTFASGDTGGSNVVLATCQHYNHVLATYNDQELRMVIQVATQRKFCHSSQKIVIYKEIQIHGPLEFNRDVSALVINKVHVQNKNLFKMAKDFSQQNNFNLITME